MKKADQNRIEAVERAKIFAKQKEILQNQAPMLIIKKTCKKRKRNSPQKTINKNRNWKQNVNKKVENNNHPLKTNKRFQIRFGPKHVGYSQPSWRQIARFRKQQFLSWLAFSGIGRGSFACADHQRRRFPCASARGKGLKLRLGSWHQDIRDRFEVSK